jgi:hypothetical protein
MTSPKEVLKARLETVKGYTDECAPTYADRDFPLKAASLRAISADALS